MSREVLSGLDFKSPLLAAGSAGSSGHVLTSQGAGATPTWAAPASTGAVAADRKLLDDITAGFNGSTATFNLTASSVAFTPANALALEVILGGIQQKPGTDYTVSGSQITFTTAPAAGLGCYIIGSTYQLPVVSAIADRELIDDIAAGFNGSTVTFNLAVSASPYNPGSALGLEVVLGGVRQRPTTDYTVSGSQITFTSAPTAGLTCLIIGWVASSTLAASATTDTTNATNISTGTLAAARLPSVNLGTTAVDLTRASGALSLTGVSIDGSAGSVAWANVSSRPTALSSFTNDTNFITSAGAPVQSVAGKTGAVTLAAADVGLGSVENTALSTWAGSTNITTIGTISSGTVPAANVSGLTEAAQDAAASLLTGGTHSGISFSYDDASNVVNATVTGGWTIITKPSDQTVTNSTTLVDDTALQIPMAANTRYIFRAVIFYDTTANADFKWRHTGPASPTLVRVNRRGLSPAATAYSGIACDTAFSSADVSLASVSANGGVVSFEGLILTSAGNSGTFIFRWAQNTADAGNTIVRAGSFIEYRVV